MARMPLEVGFSPFEVWKFTGFEAQGLECVWKSKPVGGEFGAEGGGRGPLGLVCGKGAGEFLVLEKEAERDAAFALGTLGSIEVERADFEGRGEL